MTLPFSPVPPTDVPLVSSPTASPLKKARGADYPDVGETVLAVAYVNKLHKRGEVDALARYKQATYNILYANGRQWLSWRRSQQRYEDLPLPTGDFRVTMNYIGVLCRARLQRLVSSEISWRGVPKDNSFHERDKVRAAVNLLNARAAAEEMEQKVRAGLMMAMMTGLSALKSFWNPDIGPLTAATMFFPEPVTDASGQVVGMRPVEHFVDRNGQPVSDEASAYHYRPGDTDTSLRTVFNLRLNPEATGWTEAEGLRWLIDSDLVPIEVAKERWPDIADKIAPMPSDETALVYERVVHGSATASAFYQFASSPYAGASQAPQPSQLCVVREYWEMRSPFFPKGRLIVVVGGQVAYDGAWPQGVFPYAPLFGDPAPMSPYGRPPVNDMISPQDVINREYTAIAKEMWASGTGKFVAWAIPGIPDQISKSDDEVVQVPMRSALANRSIRDVFSRLDPATVSPDRWHLIQDALGRLFDIASYHEVSRGQIPPGLDSGVAIQYLLEQEHAQLKDAVESVKRAYILWGRHQLAIAKWGYADDVTRWIPVSRPDLDVSIESVQGLDLPDPETMGLDVENYRPTSEAATRAETKDLLAMGMIDPRTGLKVLDLGSGFENAYSSETRHYTKAMAENLAFQTAQVVMQPVQLPDGEVVPQAFNVDGSPMFLEMDDDHEIHIDCHNEIALDPTQPWPVRQQVLAHIALHRQASQELQFGMMQMQAAASMPPGSPYTPPPPPPAAVGGGRESLRRPNQAMQHGGR